MAIETAGDYFGQDNPVIREITQRVQRMYVFTRPWTHPSAIPKRCDLSKKLTCTTSFTKLS